MKREIFIFVLPFISQVISGPAPLLPTLPYIASSGLVNTDNIVLPSNAANNADIETSDENLARQAPPPDYRVCLTPGCVKAAAELMNQIDQTTHPCSDFYQFACGGFIEETVLQDHETAMGSYYILVNKLNKRLKKIFESKTSANEPDAYRSVRNLYQSCMDTDQIEANSIHDLNTLVSKLGGWPVLAGDQWTGENFKWYELVAQSSQEGFDPDRMMQIQLVADSKDSKKRMIQIDQPSLGLSREYLIKGSNDKEVEAYYNYMVKTAVLMGADEKVAKTDMKEVLELELKLAEMSLPREERRNITALHNPMSIKEVEDRYQEIPLLKYINDVLKPHVTLDETEVVNIAVPEYIKKFQEQIGNFSSRTQANYIMWRNVQFVLEYLNKEALKIELEFKKVITGKVQAEPRWEKCVKSTGGMDTQGLFLWVREGSLSNAVGAMFVKKHFNEEAKKIADDIIENVRDEFKMMINELNWMDSKTKSRAKKKANQITAHIAYPKEILDDNLINEFYEGLSLKRDSYFKNMLRVMRFISTYQAKQFRKPIDKNSWKTHGGAAFVNAFYNSEENSVSFPAAFLDGVFFAADRPLYMNYGGFGFFAGHEITHGFDDEGSQKDGEGNLVDWWEAETRQKYLGKAQCMIDQYSNYTVEVEGEVLHVNGITTQGENIADNGGIKEAFRAYNNVVEKYGPEPILPGLHYSPRQLFWLSAGSLWCSVTRPKTLKRRVLTDAHAPLQFRSNGPFSNMPEFAQDWGCPVGSPMNPAKKCNVW